MGVTVANRKHGLPRIELLRKVEADIRILSIELLLEDLGDIDLSDIHWAIVGGESGPKARPMKKRKRGQANYYFSEVLEICERVYSIKLGKNAFKGKPEELKEDKGKLKELFL